MPDWPSPERVASTPRPTPARKASDYFRLNLPRGGHQPAVGRFLIAAVVAIIASLAVCAAIVAIGVTIFPATAGYDHFRFLDYAKLTVPGVVCAAVSWPIVTLFSTQARRLFAWLTVVVTLGGMAPDLWILYRGAPPEAVLALVIMHLALAAVTYPALVYIAPQRRESSPRA